MIIVLSLIFICQLTLNFILCVKIKTTRSIYEKVVELTINLTLISHILNLAFLYSKD